MSVASEAISLGELVAGKYRVLAEIGRGGMSVVYEAHHLELDEAVAIKVLLPEHRLLAGASERFAQEARAAAKVKSPHVAHIYDVGQLPNGLPYIVMERLHGEDLAQHLQRRGPLDLELTIDLMLQLADALMVAHDLGTVHRDLKPANLFVSRGRDGRLQVKLIDFGISKTTLDSGLEASQVTRGGALFGSPDYMSPEQLTSPETVDARSDIWALGVIWTECLTGRTPFEGSSFPDTCARILSGQPNLPSAFRADLPLEADILAHECLMLRREDRIQSATEWASRLRQLRGPAAAAVSAFGSERPTGLTSARTLPPPAQSASSSAAFARGPSPIVAWALVASSLVLLAAVYLVRGRSVIASRVATVPPRSSVVVAMPPTPPAAGVAPSSSEQVAHPPPRVVVAPARPLMTTRGTPPAKMAEGVPAELPAPERPMTDEELFNDPR